MKKISVFLTLIFMLNVGMALAQDYVPSTDNSTTPQWNEELRRIRDGMTQMQLSSSYSIDLATRVTGILSIVNGGTGQTAAQAAIDALLPSQIANSGKFLTTNGTNSSWSSIIIYPTYTDSSVVYIADANNSKEVRTFSSYTKVQEITLTGSGTIRVGFTLSATYQSNQTYTYGQIYKNGIAVGTEQNVYKGNAGTVTTTFENIISGCSNGDKIQLYAYRGSTAGSSNTAGSLYIKGNSMTIDLN